MRVIIAADIRPTPNWQLLHHEVMKALKPERIFVVLDCAATHQGITLADLMYFRCDIANKLKHALLIFIKWLFAIITDIEDMFM